MIDLQQKHATLPNAMVQNCIPLNTPIRFSMQSGQKLNITLIDMHDRDREISHDKVYGKVKDIGSNSEQLFGSGGRNQNVYLTSKSEIEITFKTSDDLYALEFNGKLHA